MTAFLMISSLAGCAAGGLTIPIQDPAPSAHAFVGKTKSTQDQIRFTDGRAASDKVNFSTWIVPMRFTNNGKPLDPIAYVAENTTKELVARGVPLKQVAGDDALKVSITKANIENHRVSGFSPMVTLTSMVAEVDTPNGKKRLVTFIKRAKVPVWSFDELHAPCYAEPMDLMTKELAAKINREVYGLHSTDAEVERLTAKIATESEANPLSYFDVYQLGFSNNPRAVAPLVNLTSSAKEYIRLAAISSLGIIQARDQQAFLEKIYSGIGADLWQDRAVAIKAIGDLDTPASKAFLQAEFERMKNLSDKGSTWTKAIIALYL